MIWVLRYFFVWVLVPRSSRLNPLNPGSNGGSEQFEPTIVGFKLSVVGLRRELGSNLAKILNEKRSLVCRYEFMWVKREERREKVTRVSLVLLNIYVRWHLGLCVNSSSVHPGGRQVRACGRQVAWEVAKGGTDAGGVGRCVPEVPRCICNHIDPAPRRACARLHRGAGVCYCSDRRVRCGPQTSKLAHPPAPRTAREGGSRRWG